VFATVLWLSNQLFFDHGPELFGAIQLMVVGILLLAATPRPQLLAALGRDVA
jgi:hypothetical protein